jgi:hypothetical protein
VEPGKDGFIHFIHLDKSIGDDLKVSAAMGAWNEK